MKRQQSIFSIGSIQIILLFIISCPNPTTPATVDLSAYLLTTPGLHLEYDFVTGGIFSSGKRWITFQNMSSDGSARYLYTGESGEYGSTKWSADSTFLITGYSAVGSQMIGYNLHPYISSMTHDGTTYSGDGANFTVTTDTSYGSYPDCVRIDFDATASEVVSTKRGTGHFYLARGVGIVYKTFTHSEAGSFGDAGDSFSYTLSSSETVTKKTFSGTITSSSYPVIVSICTGPFVRDYFFTTETDGSGNFSLDFYFKGGIPLTRYSFGYDIDNNDEFDDSPPPMNYDILSFPDGDLDIGIVAYN